jgi:nucleoid-associated protein YgaU
VAQALREYRRKKKNSSCIEHFAGVDRKIMALKETFGGATVPLLGASALAVAAAFGYVLYTERPSEDVAAPEAASQTAPEIIAQNGDATGSESGSDVVAPPAPPAEPQSTVASTPETPSTETVQPEPAQVAPTKEMTLEQPTQELGHDDVHADAPDAVETVETIENSINETAENPESVQTEDLALTEAPDEAPVEAPAADILDTAQSDTVSESSERAAVEDVVPDPIAPSFDVVRISPDGLSTVAGRADAGADILVLIDGIEVTRSAAGSSGDFVALFDLESSDVPRELQLVSELNGKRAVSDSSIVVAPRVQTAALETSSVENAQDAEPKDPIEHVSHDNLAPTLDVETKPVVADAVAPAVLKADDEGVKILQSASAVSSVTIDAITYNPQGDVFASGRAIPGTQIRLYLDNKLLTQTTTGADGQWRSKMDVPAGIYALRADMLDEANTVKNRVELQFKREDIAVLAEISGLDAPSSSQRAQNVQEQDAEKQDAGSNGAVDISDAQTSGATDNTDAPQTQAATSLVTSRIASVTVQPGNTLWGIASDTYGDGFLFARVFDANITQIRDPDLIYPGQVFVLPE